MAKPPGIFNVAVEAVILNGSRILITQRANEREHEPGEWEILTGRVDQGETFEEAVKREVMEEVGLDVDIFEPFNTFHFYRGKEKAEHLGLSFICMYKGGEVTLQKEEQQEYKWATPEEATKLIINPSIISSINKAKKYLQNT
jgi:8-oxo-dGTP diphosphatase